MNFSRDCIVHFPMKIGKKVKIALDETRMLVLGAQILIGFQFRSVFQNRYDDLPAWSRYLDGTALLLMILALGLLLLPGPYHHLVEEHKDSGTFLTLTSRVAGLALAPFAVSLGIDMTIAAERMFGLGTGIAAGVSFSALAVLLWYGIEAWRMRSTGQRERAMTERQRDEVEDPGLHEKINQMLTEARVVLPGAQALLGFQLAIVLTEAFDKLPATAKLLHACALGFVAVSIMLLMAPAAYHRIVYAGEDSEAFHRIGGRFVTLSTIPLALGLATDVFVVGARIVSLAIAVLASIAVLALLIGLWHALPMLARLRRRAAAPHSPPAALRSNRRRSRAQPA